MVVCPHCHAQNADGARFCGACGKATQSTHPQSDPHIVAEPASLVGREIAGRFRILAKLGEGGMGAVYRAEQTSLKRIVALKVLRPEVANSPLLVRRFTAEAEAVAKLSHPNTVGIYDYGQDADGTVFISMEFIEGRSLRAIVHTEAPLPLRRALAIILQVCASLIDAHGHGIVHRDLKPDNVMLQDRGRARDVVRVLDFGIAKLRDDSRQSQMAMTQAGDMLGTPQYMAPEQIRGETIDGRADIYSLGCMLYEMVTARLPYDAPNVMALLSKHLIEQVTPPSQRRPDLMLPPAIDDLVLTAMAKHPAARPPTMEAFAERVAAVMATLPPETGPSQIMSSPAVGIPTPGHLPMAHAHSPAPGYGTPGLVAPAPTPAPSFPPPPMPPPAAGPSTPPPVALGTGQVPPPVTATPAAPPNRTLLWVVIALAFIAAMAGIGWYLQRDVKKPPPDPPDPWSKTDGTDGTEEPEEAEASDPPEPLGMVTPPTPPSPPSPQAATVDRVNPGSIAVPGVGDLDLAEATEEMQEAYAQLAAMGKGSENIRLKAAPGWHVQEIQGMKVAARMNPQTTLTFMSRELFGSSYDDLSDYAKVDQIEILGAQRKVIAISGSHMVEMTGPGYDCYVMIASTSPSTTAEVKGMIESLVTLPPP